MTIHNDHTFYAKNSLPLVYAVLIAFVYWVPEEGLPKDVSKAFPGIVYRWGGSYA